MDRKTIAIDFDGTICRKQSYGDGTIWQTPNSDAQTILKKLKADGYRLVVFTVRLSPDKLMSKTNIGKKEEFKTKRDRIVAWLERNGIPFDDVVGHKPNAMAYIDDRAIRFTNWTDISNYFLQ